MQIINAHDYEQMSQDGATIILDTIRHKKDAIIALATGGSPKRMYEIMVQTINEQKIDISQVRFVKLDEWYGIDENSEATCTTFIQKHILSKLYMAPKEVISFATQPSDETLELKKVQDFVEANPIDVLVLGLGMNGHLGLNEPNDYLTLPCHKAKLHAKTKTHAMASNQPLEYGLTLGMQAIFEAKHVLMLVSGSNKEEAYESFLSQKISTQTPASFLWLHPHCTTIIDTTQFPQKK